MIDQVSQTITKIISKSLIINVLQFMSLRMWKMQLLDVDNMLIRYASEDVVTAKIQEPSTQASFFMIYNMTTATVN